MKRFRRLKKSENLRRLVKDVYLSKDDLIFPLFIIEGKNIKEEISSLPGQYRFSIDQLDDELDEIHKLGIKSVLLFGIPEEKDSHGSGAYDDEGIVQKAVCYIKDKYPELVVITDVCMCEYTSHGHCGIPGDYTVENDVTIDYLSKIAVSHAKSGADIVAPSDMMDGRVEAIRNALDNCGFEMIPIMSYSIKYASAYYGPFRDAAGSAPEFGDRKGYQMDFTRKKEAVQKILQDIKEGADIAIIKPALAYLDIVNEVRKEVNIPLVAYNVSGEYAMVKAAAAKGWIDEQKIVMENMYAMKRAGVDMIITYHAKDVVRWLD